MDTGAAAADGRLSIGDKLLNVKTKTMNKNLENVSHEDAVATLKAITDRVVLTVQKAQHVVHSTSYLNQNNSQSMNAMNNISITTGLDHNDSARTHSPLPVLENSSSRHASTNVLATPRAVSHEDITR
jgi:disks large protein 1